MNEMKNLWVVYDEPVATWVADLSVVRHEPRALLDWLLQTLAAGDERQVYVPRAAPLADYERERDGPPTDFFARAFAERGVVDLFDFASSGMRVIDGARFSAASRVAYYERGGQLVESEVDDLGMLLRALRAEDVDAAPNLMKRYPPLVAAGPRLDFNDPDRSVWALRRDEVRVSFRIFSDIWLPWVRGFLEEDYDLSRRFDNRPLASRHAPRLNAFLSHARAATLAAGGTWELDDEDSKPDLRFMVEAGGIRLEAELPDGITGHGT
jgi:hypothetical protein